MAGSRFFFFFGGGGVIRGGGGVREVPRVGDKLDLDAWVVLVHPLGSAGLDRVSIWGVFKDTGELF